MTDLPIDTSVCASLLRGISDQLLADRVPPRLDADLPAIISGLRSVSEHAARQMRSALQSFFPEVAWAEEEADKESPEEVHWVYDPIDGAYHFLQGLPLWSATLTLVQSGKPLFALVYDPHARDLYMAVKGKGAMRNGLTLRVSSKPSLDTAVIGTAIPPRAAVSAADHRQSLAQLSTVAQKVFVVRAMASASLQLAYVASGALDGYFEVGRDVNDWLSGSLLIEEAGGVVSNYSGSLISRKSDGIIAAPYKLHEPLLELLTPP